jgi:hypothetical protein
MKNLLIIVILACILLSSCEKKSEPSLINLYGGYNRNNNYEKYGSFPSFTTFIDKASNFIKMNDSSGAIVAPLVISESQVLIATINGSIIMFDRTTDTINKKTSWSYKLDSSLVVASGMCGDIDKNIYAILSNGELLSLSKNGNLRWKYRYSNENNDKLFSSDLLAVNDGIIASLSNGLIFKLSFDGKLLWERKSNWSTTNTFAGDSYGNLYIPITKEEFGASDSLIMLDKNGKLLWQKTFEKVRIIKTPVIQNGNIYISGLQELNNGRAPVVIAIDTSGKEIWKKELAVVPRHISTSNDGSIYIIGYNSGIGEAMSGVFCFTKEGKLKWQLYFEAIVPAPLMVGKENLAFIGRTPKALACYFMNKEGQVTKTISLTDIPTPYLQPVVMPNGAITMAGAEKSCLIRIDETPINKILPW